MSTPTDAATAAAPPPQEPKSPRPEPDTYLPPLRMHATKGPQRLIGTVSSTGTPGSLVTSPRSRSRSPYKDGFSLTAVATTNMTATTHDTSSSISSIDDIVDQDILTDRAGLEELDLTESQRKFHMSRELTGSLSSVNERMSEDALEDVHAFSDVEVVRSSNASRANSIGTGGGAVLEPLSEYGEEDLDDIEEEDEPTQVILTNMENLTLQLEQQTRRGDSDPPHRGTGGSSEAPTA